MRSALTQWQLQLVRLYECRTPVYVTKRRSPHKEFVLANAILGRDPKTNT